MHPSKYDNMNISRNMLLRRISQRIRLQSWDKKNLGEILWKIKSFPGQIIEIEELFACLEIYEEKLGQMSNYVNKNL